MGANKNEEIPENLSGNSDVKQKIVNWLKNPSNLIFFLAFVFIIILRFYYFLITKNQPLWWDESEYMSAAKNYAGIVDYQLSSLRFPGLPLLASIFFRLDLTNEVFLRLVLGFLPSILTVFLIYLAIKEMYPDKRIALISLIIFGVLWENLFYSNRFHTENFGLIFQAIAFIVLFRVYLRKQNLWIIRPKLALFWIFFFLGFSVFFRQGNLMILPPLFLFIIILNKSKIFNKRTYPFLAILAFLAIIVAFLLITGAIHLPETGMLSKKGLFAYYHPETKFAWNNLLVFQGFYQSVIPKIPSVLYYAFLIGLLIVFWELFLYSEYVKKISVSSINLKLKSHVFNIITIVLILIYFIFIQRAIVFEYRWYFAVVFAMLSFTAIGIIRFSEYIAKMLGKKQLAVIFIVFLLTPGVYTQIAHADSIIKSKVNSYIQIKESGLWMKGNSEPGDIIFSRSPHQITYYSERKTIGYGEFSFNITQFLESINRFHPKYLMESGIEPGIPPWMIDQPEEIRKILRPVKVWYADPQEQQAVLIIYEIQYPPLQKNIDFFSEETQKPTADNASNANS